MAVQNIHTFLVHPRKGSEDEADIQGTNLDLNGRLFDLLNDIYNRSDAECDIDIKFTHTPDGVQQNDCRDLVRQYAGSPTKARGRAIARRLEANTDKRSGLGLLFLIAGQEGNRRKLLISRFPTDVAIYVEEDPQAFTVEFLERVFMKNRASYKAVMYSDNSVDAGFWKGKATDKQLNSQSGEPSNYWIADFLASEFTVTAAAGTRRLASAFRSAIEKADLDLKQEIMAAATLSAGLAGQRTSIENVAQRFGLSPAAQQAIAGELKNPRTAREMFQFDLAEFNRLAAFKTTELSNNGILTAPSANFDDIFHREVVDEATGQIRITTEGKVINEKLKSKP